MAKSATELARILEIGAEPSASSLSAPPGVHAVADIVVITTHDDFLLELGAVLGAQAGVHPVESLSMALEQMGASRRAHILVFDTRGMADLRNSVGRAYARAPDAAILLFAQAADEERIRRAFNGSRVFAVLPIPLDPPRTALSFADALTDALAKQRAAPALIATAIAIPTATRTPRKRLWALGAVLAVLVLATAAWFIVGDKRRAASDARELAADHPSLPQVELKLTHYIAPEYPAAALSRNVGGTVIVAYTVDAQGTTRDVRVVSAEPAEIFNRDAIDAVKRWRYAPLAIDSAAAAVPTRTAIRFTPR